MPTPPPTKTETPEPYTPGPWGMEMVDDEIWIGPMREDRPGRVSYIACRMYKEGLTPEHEAVIMANARRIIHCVNSMEPGQ